MVQLVEITGVLNEKGCIEIPIVLLAQTGIRTGEEVNLIYLAAGEKDYRNESREFMLKRAEEDPLEELQSGETELKLPPQLLADAHIPLDADLDIVCLDRKIVILPTEDVESEDVPKELLDICADLGIPREKVNIVLRMTEEENGTKMPHTEQYKDSVYFADKSMKQQFDMAVETAYQESVLTPVLDQDEPEEGMEQEETTGMSMGM